MIKTRLLIPALLMFVGLSAQQEKFSTEDLAFDFLETKYERWQLDQGDIQQLRLTDRVFSKHSGVTHLYFVQQYNGIDIQNATFHAHIKDGKVVHATQQLVSSLSSKVISGTRAISSQAAVKEAHDHLGLAVRAPLVLKDQISADKQVYNKGALSHLDITSHLTYVRNEDGQYQLAWDVTTEPVGDTELWTVQVDASTGNVISKRSLTVHCSFPDHYLGRAHACDAEVTSTPEVWPLGNGAGPTYNVIAIPNESPKHADRELLVDPSDPEASKFGWHDLDGVDGPDTTITMGNNVHAFIDRDGNFEPNEPATDGGDTLNFDFPFDQKLEPVDYQDATVTNLFYMNNIMHDFSYFYGFDEFGGNFQDVNYTNLGAGNDGVVAHSQFNAGSADPSLNNATFGTPADGGSGRMRMFNFEGAGANQLLRVDAPAEVAGTYETSTTNAWGGAITSEPLTGEVAIVMDASGAPTQGCNMLINPEEIDGKIALIDRGNCEFGLKALNAQEAGAIGFIICNFQEGLVNMGAGAVGDQVTIPGVFIGNADCQQIRVWVENGLTVSFVNEAAGTGPARRESSFDNGIIAHEYGHGISNRLTGGPNNAGCLFNYDTDGDGASDDGEQMGEGWSDFFGLVTTARPGDVGEMRRGVGTYSLGQDITGNGFRAFAYSTDMAVNPLTYDDIAYCNGPQHCIGTVWCTMLWDMYWLFVDRYGFDADLYRGTGGNNQAIQLVMDGLKLQTCNPGLVDGRDAILKADTMLNGAANSDIIWQAFAQRGLGYSADQGDDRSRHDGAEAFDLHPLLAKELKVIKKMTPNIEPGQQITVTLYAVNHKEDAATGVVVSDAIPDGTTYINGSANLAADLAGDMVSFNIENLPSGDTVMIEYMLQSSSKLFSSSILADDMENGDFNWDLIIDEPIDQVLWGLQEFISFDGLSWACESIDTSSDQSLVTLNEITVTGDQPLLTFYHKFDTEKFFDAGIIQVSKDNGFTWTAVPEENVIRGGYTGKIQFSLFAIPNIRAWHGTKDWHQVVVDLSNYAGEDIKVRFRFASDGNTSVLGWFMDNFEVMEGFSYNSEACITSIEGDNNCAVAAALGTLVASSEVSAIERTELDGFAMQAYPNPVRGQLQIDVQAKMSGPVRISLNSSTGQTVWSSEAQVQGNYSVQIDSKAFPEGIYFVNVAGESGTLIKKIIVQ